MNHSKNCRKKVAKRRARLWEDTIVCTLRDMQWLAFCARRSERRGRETLNLWKAGEDISEVSIATRNKNFDRDAEIAAASVLNKGAVPPGFIKLDGLAESAHGDVAFTTEDEKFFLIEVKSEASRIRDEWRKGENFKPKRAYESVRKLLRPFSGGNAPDNSDLDLLETSLRCHLFAYWKVVPHEENVLGGMVVSTPYLHGCNENTTDSDRTLGFGLPAVNIPAKVMRKTNAKLEPNEFLAESLFNLSSGLKFEPEGVDPSVGNFGADFDAFKRYVEFLSGKQDGEKIACPQPIHAVILSTRGFFRVVGDTSTLAETLQLVSSLKFKRGFSNL